MPYRFLRPIWVPPLLVIMAVACDGESVAPPATPYVLELTAGSDQVGRAGQDLPAPLLVTVMRNGDPVAGVEVLWATTDGTLETGGETDAEGVARAAWTLPSREGMIRATASLRFDGQSVQFLGESRHPTFMIVAGRGQSPTVGEGESEPMTVRATWEDAPLVGAQVAWSPSNQTTVTDADGYASVRVPVGTRAGTRTITARLGDLTGPRVEFQLHAQPGPVATVILLNAFSGYWLEGVNHFFTVRAEDSYNNAVAGAPVAWVVTAGAASLNETSGRTDNNGWASVLFEGGSGYSGDIEIHASVGAAISPSQLFHHVDFVFANPTGFGDIVLGAPDVSVRAGSTVVWVHNGSEEHRLHAVGDANVPGPLGFGETLEHQFQAPGTYTWLCAVHAYEVFTITVTP